MFRLRCLRPAALVTLRLGSIPRQVSLGGPHAAGGDGSGHRRSQTVACDDGAVSAQLEAINTQCCSGPGAACSGGSIGACDAECGALIAPLLAACAPALARVGALEPLRAAAALCPAAARPFSAATVAEYLVTCPPGTVAADCVPACTRDVNGDLLLRAGPAPFRARAPVFRRRRGA